VEVEEVTLVEVVVVVMVLEVVIIDLTISSSHSHRGFLHSIHRATGIMASILNTEEGKET
jgi:membrane-bound metal-dependent hydrolase YbcI (DUF457 family)